MHGRTRMGPWGVEATAARLADFHGALVSAVHCLGAWIAAVPGLETKVRWGYHLYDYAHLADLLSRRIRDLMADRSEVPSPSNRSLLIFLREMAALKSPEEQVAGLYQVLLPAVLESAREQMERTNPVADEPTVRILYHVTETIEEHLIWAARVPADRSTGTRLRSLLAEVGGLHGPGMNSDELPEIRPVLVSTPARDDRFTPLEPGQQMPEGKPLTTAEGRILLLHNALINLEIPAMEVCGRMIAEFPDVSWEMKLDLARQIWDGARHAEMCADRLLELGGRIGQYPYDHSVWEHSTQGITLAEWVTAVREIHEGSGLYRTLQVREALAEAGDMETSQIMDYIHADKVNHVRNCDKWLNRLEAGRSVIESGGLTEIRSRRS